MNENDKKERAEFRQSAHAIGQLLDRHTTLGPPGSLSISRAAEDGWYSTIASLSQTLRPAADGGRGSAAIAVSIDVWLDRILGGPARAYWVGLASEDDNEVRSVAERSKLERGDPFDDDHDQPPKDRRLPILERWSGDGGYFGIYSEPGTKIDFSRALHFLCDVLRTIPGFENAVRTDNRQIDTSAIECDPFRLETTKKQLVDARIGQGLYRQRLDKLWNGSCAVLGISSRSVLRASHVKPWKLSNDKERLDPHNGLLLTAHLDALFDSGLITFSPSGDLLVSDEVSKSDRALLHLGGRLRCDPSPQLQSYLRHHLGMFEARRNKSP